MLFLGFIETDLWVVLERKPLGNNVKNNNFAENLVLAQLLCYSFFVIV